METALPYELDRLAQGMAIEEAVACLLFACNRRDTLFITEDWVAPRLKRLRELFPDPIGQDHAEALVDLALKRCRFEEVFDWAAGISARSEARVREIWKSAVSSASDGSLRKGELAVPSQLLMGAAPNPPWREFLQEHLKLLSEAEHLAREAVATWWKSRLDEATVSARALLEAAGEEVTDEKIWRMLPLPSGSCLRLHRALQRVDYEQELVGRALRRGCDRAAIEKITRGLRGTRPPLDDVAPE